MRNPLGFSILLVLIVGFVCASSSAHAYLYEDSTEDERAPIIQAPNSGPTETIIASSSKAGDETVQPDKRTVGLGMPASSSRVLSSLPAQISSNSQESSLSAPVNSPMGSSSSMSSFDQPANQAQQSHQQSQDQQQQQPNIYPQQVQQPQPDQQQQQQQQQSNSQQSQQQQMQSSQEQQQHQQHDSSMKSQDQAGSTARGLGTDFISAIKNVGATADQFSGQIQAQVQQAPTDVRPEDLPTIIEKNKPVEYPNAHGQSQVQLQSNQQAGLLASGPLQTVGSNTSLAMSSARTFDGWTNCVGSHNNKYGTCKNDVECQKSKGIPDGSCMGGFGVCCVMALSCGEKSFENNTFFANPDYPQPSWEARLCEVELKKKHKNILQIMIEFEDFELAPPNVEGECITDVFQVKLASNRPSPYSLLRICGQNTGQHMYLDVSQIDEPLVLSVATSGGGFPRRWSIRIVQMDDKNFLLAPPGCLQYYTDTVGHFRSFNLGRSLKGLYYAICFRIDNGYSGIRFTENFFGMNGPQCRRRQGTGRLNGFEAHPHHLVIPPPGYGASLPSPRQKFGSQLQSGFRVQQGGRIKRMAYAETGERATRTLFEDKELKHEEKEFKHEGYYPMQQGGYRPVYGPPMPTYGPPKQIYPEYPHYKEEKFDEKLGFKEAAKTQTWSEKMSETFGFKANKELAKQEFKQGYQPGYGPPGYHGPLGYYGPQGYGQQGYGENLYHHKEIDKFGKNYKHLESKHESNHLHKDEKTSSWWPLWNTKKEEKKDKEKFFQHHEAHFPFQRIPEMPHCEPRFCGQNDVITFPPSGDSISEMCGNRFNRGRGPKIISGSPLVVYVSNKGHQRGAGFDMNYEQVFYIPRPY